MPAYGLFGAILLITYLGSFVLKHSAAVRSNYIASVMIVAACYGFWALDLIVQSYDREHLCGWARTKKADASCDEKASFMFW